MGQDIIWGKGETWIECIPPWFECGYSYALLGSFLSDILR